MSSAITKVDASQIFDSRGNPTVQVDLYAEHGKFTAMVPSGASTSSYEACELRDGDKTKYGGKGVFKAVNNVRTVLGPELVSSRLSPTSQSEIDAFLRKLDGTPNKSKLGANAILGVSMAVARAGAAASNIPLYDHLANLFGAKPDREYVMPVPFFNVLNGGVHSGNTLAPQEFMIAPVGATSFEEAMQLGTECYHQLKSLIAEKYGKAGTGIGDEGGFAPPISTFEEAFDLLTAAVERAGHTGRVKFGIDPASSEFYSTETSKYNLGFKAEVKKEGQIQSSAQMIKLYSSLLKKYPIVLLEDPFAEDDWPAWTEFCKLEGGRVELVGDDLLSTNVERIKTAVEKKACNSLLLKVNQIGTVTESLDAAHLAHSSHWSTFVSHRSGETTDSFIADLVVALGNGHLKSGAPARGERVAKYNRLLEIERELKQSGKRVRYAGEGFRTAWGQ
ncbi:enolase [Laetiporus sulphureus 93-53]|uniref:phosphopyruvate hydratase n=1 Tax=Laetiporus sulphureus 93-53 TaxID=1314785 RepID=A0A165H716_9APHY|nr:enolase [Laetiporus sulphureus 93-53]KZT11333.1 enolase [Laetiporus sulphureus 93-53]